jgi:hypothetical protein
MNDRKSLRTQIAGAVAAVRGGEEDHAILRLSRLTAAAQPVIRDSVRELATANVEMLHAAVACGAHFGVEFSVDGEDVEGRPVSIDEFEPSQRASTRIMLAFANDRPGDAEIQLDIVAAAPGQAEMALVFVNTMCWTLELLDVCEEIGYEVPDWLHLGLTA